MVPDLVRGGLAQVHRVDVEVLRGWGRRLDVAPSVVAEGGLWAWVWTAASEREVFTLTSSE